MFGNFQRGVANKATSQATTFLSTKTNNFFNPYQYAQQRRNMGIKDYIGDKIEGKKMEMQQHKERESFRKLRDYLISCPKYRFKEQAQFIESLLGTIGKTDRLIGGAEVKAQEEMMNKKISLYKAFTPLELLQDSGVALNMAAKTRISLAAGVDRAVLQQEITEFEQSKSIHTWIHQRLKNGKTLPENHIELQQLMRLDPPPPSAAQLQWIQKQKAQAKKTRYK
eukprot:UN01002